MADRNQNVYKKNNKKEISRADFSEKCIRYNCIGYNET